MKTGVLFVVSVASGAGSQRALAAVGRLAAQRPWGADLRWGALKVARQAAAPDGIRPLPLPQALRRLRRDGYAGVVVQPLMVVCGTEFEKLRLAVIHHQHTGDRFARYAVGAPLLGSAADLGRVAGALLAGVAAVRARGDGLILVGHGSAGVPADLAYLAAARVLGDLDRRAFLGCVNGAPDLADVRRRCRAARLRRAFLLPFTTVAGSTVREALARDGAGSWVDALAADGIEGLPLPQGLGENEAVAGVWLDHAGTALAGLRGKRGETA